MHCEATVEADSSDYLGNRASVSSTRLSHKPFWSLLYLHLLCLCPSISKPWCLGGTHAEILPDWNQLPVLELCQVQLKMWIKCRHKNTVKTKAWHLEGSSLLWCMEKITVWMTYTIRILPPILLFYSACAMKQVGLFSLSHSFHSCCHYSISIQFYGVLRFQSFTGLSVNFCCS